MEYCYETCGYRTHVVTVDKELDHRLNIEDLPNTCEMPLDNNLLKMHLALEIRLFLMNQTGGTLCLSAW